MSEDMSVADLEREALYAELQRINLSESLVVLEMKPAAVARYRLTSPFLVLPVEYVLVIMKSDGEFGPELLAVALSESVGQLRRSGDTRLFGSTLLGLAQILRHRATIDREWEIIAEAIGVFTRLELPREVGRCLVELGTALRDAGFVYDALTSYRRAAEFLSDAGDLPVLRDIHYNRGVVARSHYLYEECILELDRMVDLGLDDEPNPAVRNAWRSERAACAVETADLGTAAVLVEKFLAEAVGFNLTVGHYLRARLRIAGGERTAAQDDLRAAMVVGARSIRSHRTLASRDSDRRQLEVLFDTALTEGLRAPAPDLAVATLLLAKSARGGALRPRFDADEASAVADRLAPAFAATAKAATRAVVSRDRAELETIAQRASALVDQRDVQTAGVLADGTDVASDLVHRIVDAIPSDAVAAEIFVAPDGRLWSAVIQAGNIAVEPLPLDISTAQRLAAAADLELWARQRTRALDRLGRLLLTSLRHRLPGVSRLFLVLPSELATVPLHAADIDGTPLAAQVNVGYLPSLEFLRAGGPSVAATTTSDAVAALAVPDPAYEVFDVLLSAEAEATALAETLSGVRVYTHDAATTRVLATEVSRARLVHVAGHAAFQRGQPLLARVYLADRPLFAFEIANLRVVSEVVNLSGCRTAMSRQSRGGESEGLAAAFLTAGAETVVASWWPVDDETAAVFNEMFYDELVSGRSAWDAVNAAQRRLCSLPGYDHPQRWAAFTASGVPRREEARR